MSDRTHLYESLARAEEAEAEAAVAWRVAGIKYKNASDTLLRARLHIFGEPCPEGCDDGQFRNQIPWDAEDPDRCFTECPRCKGHGEVLPPDDPFVWAERQEWGSE